jgi:hypothetical protein
MHMKGRNPNPVSKTPKMNLGSKIGAKIATIITEKNLKKESQILEHNRLAKVGQYALAKQMLDSLTEKSEVQLLKLGVTLDDGIKNPTNKDIITKADSAASKLSVLNEAYKIL